MGTDTNKQVSFIESEQHNSGQTLGIIVHSKNVPFSMIDIILYVIDNKYRFEDA
jgi:hypothetical protein